MVGPNGAVVATTRQAAETTRQAALSLGTEADHGKIIAWAHEMRAWINLTRSDYHGVITAARAGTEVTPHSSVAVQLAAQEAKAWSRMGDLLFHLMPESAAISGNFSRQS